ncbi:hypothetical protein [Streptomyces sp. CC208A]|uniref:hypothetical protein n=1 Tax=Streptomyces sp. CC208A TaxID=3044573 RepID=UPI0024A8A876|nr:hypothetical protein [Streptomyces sp. CC208A]
MGIQPWSSVKYQDNSAAPSTRVSVVMDPVPAGKLLIVEHLSGYAAIGQNDTVDEIWASDGNTQQAQLPVHFASRPLNYGGGLGVARRHQFGSPVRMYVSGGAAVTVNVDANTAGFILAKAVGRLVDP